MFETEEEKVSFIALMISDVPGGPYYPMFTPEQYVQFLKFSNGNVNRAVVYAAMSAGFFVSGESSREVIGELQISSSTGTNYLKLLDYLIKTAGSVPPPNMMPWMAGADSCDRNALLEFRRCDPHFPQFGSFSTCSGGC